MVVIIVAVEKEAHRSQVEEINILNYEAALSQMQHVYKKQKDSLNQILAFIGLLYMSYSVDGLIKINKYQKAFILQDIYSKLQPIGQELGKYEANEITDILNKAYENTYIKNAYLVGVKINTPSTENIKNAVKSKINGELFSNRIWNNKDDLITRIKKSINMILNGRTTIDQAGKQIEKTFNINAYQSHRLLVTELSRVQAQASIDMAKAAGIKEHMWSATFEHSCDHCVELDGQVFKINDKEAPSIPAHPNCRCLWVNVPNDIMNEKSGKDSDSNVNWNDVNTEEYRKKFNGIGDNETVDDSIYNTAMRILKHRDGVKFEDLYILDLNNGRIVTYTTQNTELGIKKTEKLERILFKKGAKYIIIHNHPHSSPFSESDLRTLFNSVSVSKMIAIGHDGSVFTINKNLTPDIVREYRKYYNILIKQGFSDYTSMDRALKEISIKYQLGYERR